MIKIYILLFYDQNIYLFSFLFKILKILKRAGDLHFGSVSVCVSMKKVWEKI